MGFTKAEALAMEAAATIATSTACPMMASLYVAG